MEGVTFVVHHKIKPRDRERYEKWLPTAFLKAAEYPGHHGVQIIRPVGDDGEYAIILRWASYNEAKIWAESSDRKQLIREIEDMLENPDRTDLQAGIDFWFTPPHSTQKKAKPWKQWLVTTSVIWPLTMTVPPLLKPVFLAIPWLAVWPIGHLITASVIVGLVTYWIMPYYVRAISGWMFR